jgi:hypothetical protein
LTPSQRPASPETIPIQSRTRHLVERIYPPSRESDALGFYRQCAGRAE